MNQQKSIAEQTYVDQKFTVQQDEAAVKSDKANIAQFDLDRAVADASGKHYIDADLIHSIIRQESGGKVHARSVKGAQGLMQLMPDTAAKLGVTNAYDGNANVDAGTRYFRDLLERYHGDMIKALRERHNSAATDDDASCKRG